MTTKINYEQRIIADESPYDIGAKLKNENILNCGS
jgi:hypothetical protein